MKIYSPLLCLLLALGACGNSKDDNSKATVAKADGTWQLKSSYAVTNGDTVNTSPAAGIETIKIINGTHFAFFTHDKNHGKDSSAVFVAGGGTYSLNGNTYEENLAYCNAREWEGHKFKFTISLTTDTLKQRGIEKIDSLNVDREIIEIYARKK